MADQATIIGMLAASALFKSLEPSDLTTIAGLMRPTAFSSGQLIFSRGDTGRDVYLVLEGRVRLSILSGDGRELSLIHAASGDLFGEFAALDGSPRSADATAITPVKAMLLPGTQLSTQLERNPRIGVAAIRFLCQRLRETNEKLEAIALHPIEVRLARFLLTAIRLQDGKPAKSVALNLDMSQGELAMLVGASRPKVNVALTLLEDVGAIVRNGTRLTCEVAELERVAAQDGA